MKINYNDEKFRHEFKYLISNTEMAVLKSRIKDICSIDPHVENGIYNIRSIYFDDYDNNCYYENENGTDPREKFRIRIYNGSDSVIKLECKRKERGKTLKTSSLLTREQTEEIIAGKIPDIDPNNNLLNKLILLMRTRLLKPVVIVEYDRIPYIHINGNVRITFDMNLSSSCQIDDFFKERGSKRPVMPAGYLLMEVKYDEFLPDEIYRALQINCLEQTAYSKYYLCRKYTLKGR